MNDPGVEKDSRIGMIQQGGDAGTQQFAGTLHQGIGAVEFRHPAAKMIFLFRDVDWKTGSGDIERGMDACNPTTHDQRPFCYRHLARL